MRFYGAAVLWCNRPSSPGTADGVTRSCGVALSTWASRIGDRAVSDVQRTLALYLAGVVAVIAGLGLP